MSAGPVNNQRAISAFFTTPISSIATGIRGARAQRDSLQGISPHFGLEASFFIHCSDFFANPKRSQEHSLNSLLLMVLIWGTSK
ncbi:MAG TPA: hypothetical protein VGW09_03565, partial [Nitrososphaeraceae archaeon]|nr:hypothetical protein [Nitrososphaeraceae archaeon]